MDCRKLNTSVTRNFYDQECAAVEDRLSFSPGTLLREERLLAHRISTEQSCLDKLVQFGRHETALDIGCGSGRWLVHIAPRVRRVVGVDFSERMVILSRRNLAARQITNAEVLAHDASLLPQLGRFDVVLAMGVLHYLNEDQFGHFVRALPTLLSDRGRVILAVSVTRQRIIAEHNSPPAVYRTAAEYKHSFASAGFSLACEADMYSMPSLTPRLMRWMSLGDAALSAAIKWESRFLHSTAGRMLVSLYHKVTKRGCGEQPMIRCMVLHLDRFAEGRPA